MPALAREPVREHDVDGEERGVRERERDADGLALELHVGQQVDAGDGEPERETRCAPSARPAAASSDDGQELDRRDRAERQRGRSRRRSTRSSPRRRRRARRTSPPRRRGRAARARATAAARARRSRPRSRSGARRRRAARRGRRGARRTPGRGSGRPRCRRSSAAGAASRVARGAPRGAVSRCDVHSDMVVAACHSGMADRRTWRQIASKSKD